MRRVKAVSSVYESALTRFERDCLREREDNLGYPLARHMTRPIISARSTGRESPRARAKAAPFRRAETTSMKTSLTLPSRRENEKVLNLRAFQRAHKDIFARRGEVGK